MTPDRLAEARAADAAIDLTMPHPFPTRVYAHRRELLAEVDRLTRERDEALQHVDELQDKLLSMPDNGKCCCSFDGPGDVCMPHSPTVNRLTAERDQARVIARILNRRDANLHMEYEIYLGMGLLPAWLTATPPEAETSTPAIPATTDNEGN